MAVEARTQLNISCGCGFKTHDLAEAKAHTQKTSHSITILGTITPVKAPEHVFVENRLDALKSRLGK